MTVGPVDRDDATAEFFDGTASGAFLLRRCGRGHFSEPAAAQCTTCGSTDLEWAAASGLATLVSWAVMWAAPDPDQPPVPTVLVIAELAEGPWWWSQLVGTDPAGLSVGASLVISFVKPDAEHMVVPVFELAAD